MTIPLDQLYHVIDQCARSSYGDLAIIYRFDPHGSKEIKDLTFLNDYTMEQVILHPQIICYDQEPLDYDRYQRETFLDQPSQDMVQGMNLRKMNLRDWPANVWDQAILLHSEQGGHNLQQYANAEFVPVYYWSHALIARDWFRAAEFLDVVKTPPTHRFLIYNRAWTGTREYRLTLADLLIQHELVAQCRMTIDPVDADTGLHYRDSLLKNESWRPQHDLEHWFPVNHVSSTMSAQLDRQDYANTDVEIVLETLFDDDRIQLTEKTLRPIAAAQPFVLASTAGSLQYLRDYGFETYGELWSESYDDIQDPQQRLQAIVHVMKDIAAWTPEQRRHMLARAHDIADRNRRHFFSRHFEQLVINELQTNLDQAFAELVRRNRCEYWLATQQFRYTVERQRTASMHKDFDQSDWQRITQRVLELSNWDGKD